MQKYGLIGYPLKHSFSISYFNEKFQSEGIDAEYVNFEIPSINDLPGIIKGNPNLQGFNVTIPYKEKVISYLDEIDKTAIPIGAINVVKVIRQKGKVKLIGYNSDIIGFYPFHRTIIGIPSQKSIDIRNRRSGKSRLSRTKKFRS